MGNRTSTCDKVICEIIQVFEVQRGKRNRKRERSLTGSLIFRENNKPFNGNKTKIRKGKFIMLEMVILGLTVVVAQMVAGLMMFKLCLSKKFMKKYVKKYMKLTEALTEELLEEMDVE